MIAAPQRSILVIGGTGVTGRKVEQYLVKYLQKPARIDVSSRHSSKLTNHRILNPEDRAASVATIADYDLAIICAGPFEKLRASIHELCIEARTNCIDVNDSIDAARDTAALQQSAASTACDYLRALNVDVGVSPENPSILVVYSRELMAPEAILSRLAEADQRPTEFSLAAPTLDEVFIQLNRVNRVKEQK